MRLVNIGQMITGVNLHGSGTHRPDKPMLPLEMRSKARASPKEKERKASSLSPRAIKVSLEKVKASSKVERMMVKPILLSKIILEWRTNPHQPSTPAIILHRPAIRTNQDGTGKMNGGGQTKIDVTTIPTGTGVLSAELRKSGRLHIALILMKAILIQPWLTRVNFQSIN